MTILTCKSMRTAVIASAALMLLGIVLLGLVLLPAEPTASFLVVLIYPAFAALVVSPLVLLATALASLLPSINHRLENCQH